MRNKHFKFLKKLAETSDGAGGSRHAAIITKGNKILAKGVNSSNASPFLVQFGNILLPQWYLENTHAEIACLENFVKSHNYSYLHSCQMSVLRVKSDGTIGNSRPCTYCDLLITKLKLKSVEYSL